MAIIAWTGEGPFRCRKRSGPGMTGPAIKKERDAYWRIQVCDLQMKAMQPDTSSFCPPSTSAIFDL